MHSKKLLTRVLLCVLALVSIFTIVGCKEEEGSEISKSFIYGKQYENNRYYFSQGYPDDWTVTEGNDGTFLVPAQHPVYDDMGLVAQFAKGDAKYSVYSVKYPFMKASLTDYVMGLLGKDVQYNFPFNQYFVDDAEYNPSEAGGRDAFVMETVDGTEAVAEKMMTHENNDIQFCQVTYTYTVDGNEWKGAMNVATAKEGFYVITCESASSSWDANFKIMGDMLGDFHILGWETQE